MNKISFYKKVLLGISVVLFVSCDKDFNEIGADIIGDDHYDFDRETIEVIANTIPTGPIQSNNLPINPLGIYNNPAFGKTKAHFVTQLELTNPAPNVGTNIDLATVSVTLSIPYFSEVVTNNADNSKTYKIDSLYGSAEGRIDLKVFRSGYFLGTLAYENGNQLAQKYYTDQNPDFDNVKVGTKLNNAAANSQNTEFFFNAQEIVEDITSSDGSVTEVRSAPEMRLQLDAAYFKSQILETSAANLQSNSAFKNYFRGLYFQVDEAPGSQGSMAMLNFAAGKVTIKYKADITTTTSAGTTTTTMDRNIVLNMSGNTVSLLENTPTIDYQAALNGPISDEGQSRLFVKGGEGAVVAIDIFGTEDLEDGVGGGPNGIPDALDRIRLNNWLINEASLVFYIDRPAMGSDTPSTIDDAPEPRRVYLYDIPNKRPILDYAFDNTTNGDTKLNKGIYGGIVERSSDGRGTKYKVRITNYVRSLVQQDSTYVKLGLAVTENINLVSMVKTKESKPLLNDFIPTASAFNPLGTVFYGNLIPNDNATDANSDYNKRLRLEIYYTKPEIND